jgi:hypothetical protein
MKTIDKVMVYGVVCAAVVVSLVVGLRIFSIILRNRKKICVKNVITNS